MDYQKYNSEKANWLKYIGLDTEILFYLNKFYQRFGSNKKSEIFFIFWGSVISGLLEVFGLILLYLMIRILMDLGRPISSYPPILVDFLNLLGITSQSIVAILFAVSILLIFLFKNIFILIFYSYQQTILKKWRTDASGLLLMNYFKAPYLTLLKYNSSDLTRNVVTIVSQCLNGFVLSAMNYFSNLISGLVVLAILVSKYFSASVIIFGFLLISAIIQNRYLKKKYQNLGAERDKLISAQSKVLNHGFFSLKESKVSHSEEYFHKSFLEVNKQVAANESSASFYGRLPSHTSEFIIICCIIGVSIFLILTNTDDSGLTIASLGVLAGMAFRLAPVLNKVTSATQAMHKTISSMKILFSELEKIENLIPDETDIGPQTLTLKNELSIKNLFFKYPNSPQDTLVNINLKIPKGTFVGIVGESGAGKTTLVDILMGLLPPNAGDLFIDGHQVNSKNILSWQRLIGYVPQSIYLTDNSLAENVAFGINKSQIDQNLVNDCLNKVELNQFVANGGGEMLGENGKLISGGQKQRIGLARALYRNPEVLILDEATSALDVNTEYSISNLLKKFKGEKTVIVIAHRLSTVMDADFIVFMEHGKILEIGSFQDLINRNLKFKEMTQKAKMTT